MENIRIRNLAYLQKNFPQLYENVKSYSQEPSDLKIEACLTRDNSPNFKVSTNDLSIYLHSNYSPEKEAETLIRTFDVETKDTLIILGFGLGYHLKKIARLYPNKNKLVIEPSLEVFAKALEHLDISEILGEKNIQVLLSDNPRAVYDEIMFYFGSGRFSSVDFIALPSYYRLFGQMWDEVKNQYIKFMRTFTVNVRTKAIWENAWLFNFFANLKQVPESADLTDFRDQFKGVPAIMVSAGPSLSKNIALLREVGDRAIIIAAGTAISVLQKENIKPHMMLGIDGSSKMSDVYNKVAWDDILFMYVLNLHYKSLDCYHGPKMYIRSNAEEQVQWLERSLNHSTPFVCSGGSCANVTMDFVKKLGCNPVILIGQDLAYTNMQTHADGHAYGQKVGPSNFNVKELKLTKDIYGNDLYTADHWMSMAYCFENYIAGMAKDNLFINATEGGLPIAGTVNMTFRQAIDQFCKEDFGVKERISTLWEASRDENLSLKKEIVKFAKMVSKEARKLSELSGKRLNLIAKIEKNIEKGNLAFIAQQGKKLTPLTEKLEKSVLYKEIIGPISYEMLLIIKNASEARLDGVKSTSEKYRVLYEGLRRQFEEIEEKNKTIAEASEEALRRLGEEEH